MKADIICCCCISLAHGERGTAESQLVDIRARLAVCVVQT